MARPSLCPSFTSTFNVGRSMFDVPPCLSPRPSLRPPRLRVSFAPKNLLQLGALRVLAVHKPLLPSSAPLRDLCVSAVNFPPSPSQITPHSSVENPPKPSTPPRYPPEKH